MLHNNNIDANHPINDEDIELTTWIANSNKKDNKKYLINFFCKYQQFVESLLSNNDKDIFDASDIGKLFLMGIHRGKADKFDYVDHILTLSEHSLEVGNLIKQIQLLLFKPDMFSLNEFFKNHNETLKAPAPIFNYIKSEVTRIELKKIIDLISLRIGEMNINSALKRKYIISVRNINRSHDLINKGYYTETHRSTYLKNGKQHNVAVKFSNHIHPLELHSLFKISEATKKSPYIIRFFGYATTQNSLLLTVTEYANAGNLHQWIKDNFVPATEDTREKRLQYEKNGFSFVAQLIYAIHFLQHELNIIHCDVTPKNILLKRNHNNTEIRLSDFDSSRRPGDSFGARCIDNILFSPMSVFTMNKDTGTETWIDVLQLASVCFLMLNGLYIRTDDEKKFEYTDNRIRDYYDTLENIFNSAVTRNEQNFPKPFPDWIQRCWQTDVKKIPSIEELKEEYKKHASSSTTPKAI